MSSLDDSPMTPSRPYIMRALFEWIVDNGCTPYVLVDATRRDVLVPEQYVKDGQIVLNISPSAVMDLNISNDAMAFNGRFGFGPRFVGDKVDLLAEQFLARIPEGLLEGRVDIGSVALHVVNHHRIGR